jgi:hypothetical protein
MNVSLRERPYVVYRNVRGHRSSLCLMRRIDSKRLPMWREQAITFLETTVIFLLLTNPISAIVAAYAVSIAIGLNPRDAKAVVVSKASAMFAAMRAGNRS